MKRGGRLWYNKIKNEGAFDMKRIWKSLLVLAVFCLFMLGAAADEQIRIYLDGKEIAFDTPPTIINDNTLVPMRAVFEALGAEVQWNDEKQCVTANRYDTEIKLFVGQNCLYRNNLCKDMPCSSQLINDRVYVPVRAIAESFGCHVDWCEESNAVAIFTEKMYDRIYWTMEQYLGISVYGTVPYGTSDTYSIFLEEGADYSDLSKVKLLIPGEYTTYIDESLYNNGLNGIDYTRSVIINNGHPDVAENYRRLAAELTPSIYEAREVREFNTIEEVREFYKNFMIPDFFNHFLRINKNDCDMGEPNFFEYNGKLYLAYGSSFLQHFGFQGEPHLLGPEVPPHINTIFENNFTVQFDVEYFSGEFLVKYASYTIQNDVPILQAVIDGDWYNTNYND